MSRGIISTKFGPLLHDHSSILANLNTGMENSVAAALDLDESCLGLRIEENELIQELEKSLESYHKNEIYFKGQEDILKEIQSNLSVGNLSLEELESVFNDKIKSLNQKYSKTDLMDCQYLQELKKKREKLRGIQEDLNDEDILLVSQKESFKCPITQLLLVDPVVSGKCGHAYSKKEIMELISRNRELECPQAGCRHFVKASDLKVDSKISRLVAAEKTRLVLEQQKEKSTYMSI